MEAAFRGCIAALTIPWSQMKDVLKTEELELPEGVEVTIKSRQITVKGPRGTLTKNVRHIDMDIRLITGKTNKVTLAVWQGGRKHVACLRTIKSLIENMVTGVTKVCFLTDYAHGVELISHPYYRASSTRCVLCMPISLSTASFRTAGRVLRFGTSWGRRCVGVSLGPLRNSRRDRLCGM